MIRFDFDLFVYPLLPNILWESDCYCRPHAKPGFYSTASTFGLPINGIGSPSLGAGDSWVSCSSTTSLYLLNHFYLIGEAFHSFQHSLHVAVQYEHICTSVLVIGLYTKTAHRVIWIGHRALHNQLHADVRSFTCCPIPDIFLLYCFFNDFCIISVSVYGWGGPTLSSIDPLLPSHLLCILGIFYSPSVTCVKT